MANAYVSSTGSAAYPGTVNAPTSLTLAFSSAVAGDIVYIAPGTYRGTFTLGVSGSAGNTIQFIGDAGATQAISGISPGIVRITNIITDTAFPTNATMLTATSCSYFSFEGIYFDGYGTTISQTALNLTTCSNFSFTKCSFGNIRQTAVVITTSAGVAVNASFSKCTFAGTGIAFGAPTHSVNYSVGLTLTDCFALGNLITMATAAGGSSSTNGGNVVIYNCCGFGGTPLLLYSTNTAVPSVVRNCIFNAFNGFVHGGTAGSCDEDYNVIFGDYFGMNVGANTIRGGTFGLDYGYSALAGISSPSFFGPYLGSRAIANGVVSGAPATDIDGVPWYQTTPDRASYTFAGRNNVIRFFNPSDTNSITIAPGSTSQSIELYLGATGLTASTVGLSARYNKNRTADVAIPLVARTIAQPWIAGGFAEVNPATMPGVYRLDIPNEAISVGYNNTTVVVRGATGTNGAVLTIQETPSLGYQIKMGPFTVQADGILTDDRLKLIQGSVHSIDFKMVDAYGTGVDGTGTVVTAKVYNAAGFLIDTYTCTSMYALDGRYSFAIDSTVTDNVGMYTINIYRQIGTETNVFGRMKLEVLSP
jgi:hypothetical protein